jgi:hypothetical protein
MMVDNRRSYVCDSCQAVLQQFKSFAPGVLTVVAATVPKPGRRSESYVNGGASMNIAEFASWLSGPQAGRYGVEGLTDDEIDAVCAAQGTRTVPADYRAFLRLCGRDAREFQRHASINEPELSENKDLMRECLERNGSPFELPERPFVFWDDNGYQYWYFEDVEREPPLVVWWTEVEKAPPDPMFATFSDWLDAAVAEKQAIHACLTYAREHPGGELPPPVQFSWEDYRTWPFERLATRPPPITGRAASIAGMLTPVTSLADQPERTMPPP